VLGLALGLELGSVLGLYLGFVIFRSKKSADPHVRTSAFYPWPAVAIIYFEAVFTIAYDLLVHFLTWL